MIPTRCSTVDEVLGGGVKRGVVTELYGSYGVGKTQLCVQLAMNAHVVGAGGSIFIVGMRGFPARRLNQIASLTPQIADIKEMMESVQVRTAMSPYEFTDALNDVNNYLKGNTTSANNTGLLVVDPIYDMFKGQFSKFTAAITERSNMLKSIAYALKVMANKFNLAVVVCNDVGFRKNVATNQSYAPPRALGKPWLKHERDTYYIYCEWHEDKDMWVHTFNKVLSDNRIEQFSKFSIEEAGVCSLISQPSVPDT